MNKLIIEALREDLGRGDITTEAIVPSTATGKAIIIAKQEAIVAGVGVVTQVFKAVDRKLVVNLHKQDGDTVSVGDMVLELRGRVSSILKGERVALNFLSRLSGIATLTRKFVNKVAGTGVKILDTRKTIPGWRELDKYAVRVGGGYNHRMGLYDAILIKDNHIKVAGGIKPAVERVIKKWGNRYFIEIEVENLDQLREALDTPVDRIMLDNMSVDEIREAVKLNNGRKELEVSGGVNLDNIREIAETGIDYISIGAITHSAPAADFSLEIV